MHLLKLFAAFLWSCRASDANVASIARVTIDGLDSAIGITSLSPSFTWEFATPGLRNVTQTAYNIRVSSGVSGNGDVWDSGQVTSSTSVSVLYAGPGLSPAQAYFVSIRAWTSNSADPTAFSTSVRFVTGLQSAEDWDAASSFIGLESANNSACPWFRTSFMLSSKDITDIQSGASTAMLHVASVGYFSAFINGARLGSGERLQCVLSVCERAHRLHLSSLAAVLAPSIVNLGRSVPAVVLDAAAAPGALVTGLNVLGLWLGPGWGSYFMFNLTKAPLVRAELRVTPAASRGGATLVVGTNATWRARLSTTSHSGNWTSGDFGGDSLDLTVNVPGWATPAVNASGPGWEAATEYSLAREVLPQVRF